MTLKTLKDFRDIEPMSTVNGSIIERILPTDGYVKKEDLRQEGINWIKASRDMMIWQKLADYNNIEEAEAAHQGIQNFIKYFFNISEKEIIESK